MQTHYNEFLKIYNYYELQTRLSRILELYSMNEGEGAELQWKSTRPIIIDLLKKLINKRS